MFSLSWLGHQSWFAVPWPAAAIFSQWGKGHLFSVLIGFAWFVLQQGVAIAILSYLKFRDYLARQLDKCALFEVIVKIDNLYRDIEESYTCTSPYSS